ncbi:MAG: hypothetical protein V9E94_11395 [Microthrixaceae bacterium]
MGRNGMHKYNNQDHSMLTAMLTVENILRHGRARHLGRQRRRGLPRGVRPRRRLCEHAARGPVREGHGPRGADHPPLCIP